MRNQLDKVVAVFACIFIVTGLITVAVGAKYYNEVKTGLWSENIISTDEAGVESRVDTPWEAKAQADLIQEHVLNATDGRTYAELDRDDPLRDTAFKGSALRTGLLLSVLAFGVAALVVAYGGFVTACGIALLFVARAMRKNN